MALSGLYAALRITGKPLSEQRILFLGAGEAGTGIGELMVAAMIDEGCSEAQARANCWFVDSKGLIVKSREDLTAHKRAFAQDHAPLPDLLSAVKAIAPTAIVGASGQPGTFTPEVLQSMAEINDHPIVFALSNPTDKSECTAREAYNWTQGRAVFASGSPFAPITLQGRTYRPGQGNNVYIFPGMGLAAVACNIRHITDEMFLTAAKCLAKQVDESDLNQGCIYPSLKKIREVSLNIALAVAGLAYEQNLADLPQPRDLEAHIRSHIYDPAYEIYV